MISVSLISMPPDALDRIAAQGTGCGGRRSERRIALWVVSLAALAGVAVALFA